MTIGSEERLTAVTEPPRTGKQLRGYSITSGPVGEEGR